MPALAPTVTVGVADNPEEEQCRPSPTPCRGAGCSSAPDGVSGTLPAFPTGVLPSAFSLPDSIAYVEFLRVGVSGFKPFGGQNHRLGNE